MHQGTVLGSLLFNILMDVVLKEGKETVLDADDIVFCAESRGEVASKFER